MKSVTLLEMVERGGKLPEIDTFMDRVLASAGNNAALNEKLKQKCTPFFLSQAMLGLNDAHRILMKGPNK